MFKSLRSDAKLCPSPDPPPPLHRRVMSRGGVWPCPMCHIIMGGLSLVNTGHLTWIMASDWSVRESRGNVTCKAAPLIAVTSKSINRETMLRPCEVFLLNGPWTDNDERCWELLKYLTWRVINSSFISLFLFQPPSALTWIPHGKRWPINSSRSRFYHPRLCWPVWGYQAVNWVGQPLILASHWSLQITWPQYWPLIGQTTDLAGGSTQTLAAGQSQEAAHYYIHCTGQRQGMRSRFAQNTHKKPSSVH